MDNCGSHQVPAVQEAFAAANVKVGKLPVRMTGELQVMDIAINSALKARMRRQRSLQIHDYFKTFVSARKQAALLKQQLPSFTPPAMSLQDGLTLVMQTLRQMGLDDAIKHSIHRVFVNVGQVQDDDNLFRRFPGHGILHTRYQGAMKSAVDSLADLFAQVTFTPRPDWETVCEFDSE